ncbi:MAG: ferredoxin [Aquificota bacterium]|nr:ferredoxin [Aquificota bacterium]
MGLKVRVDQDTCTACELCYDRVPEVFERQR